MGICKKCKYGYQVIEGSCYPCSQSLYNVIIYIYSLVKSMWKVLSNILFLIKIIEKIIQFCNFSNFTINFLYIYLNKYLIMILYNKIYSLDVISILNILILIIF